MLSPRICTDDAGVVVSFVGQAASERGHAFRINTRNQHGLLALKREIMRVSKARRRGIEDSVQRQEEVQVIDRWPGGMGEEQGI